MKIGHQSRKELEDKQAAEQAMEAKRQQIRDELRNERPTQSVAGLTARVEKIEQVLGLREIDIDNGEKS